MCVLLAGTAVPAGTEHGKPLDSDLTEREGVGLRQFTILVQKKDQIPTVLECQAVAEGNQLEVLVGGRHPTSVAIDVLQSSGAKPRPVIQVIHLDLHNYRDRYANGAGEMRRLSAQGEVLDEVTRIVAGSTLGEDDGFFFLADTTEGLKSISGNREAILAAVEQLRHDPSLADLARTPTVSSDGFFEREARIIERLSRSDSRAIRLMLVGSELPNLHDRYDSFFAFVEDRQWVKPSKVTQSVSRFLDAIQRHLVQVASFNLCDNSAAPSCSELAATEEPFPIEKFGGKEYGGTLESALKAEQQACILQVSLPEDTPSGIISVQGKPRGYRFDHPVELATLPEAVVTKNALHLRGLMRCDSSGVTYRDCVVEFYLYLDQPAKAKHLKNGVELTAELGFTETGGLRRDIDLPSVTISDEALGDLKAPTGKHQGNPGIKGTILVPFEVNPGTLFLYLEARAPGTDLSDTFVRTIEIRAPAEQVTTTQENSAPATPPEP